MLLLLLATAKPEIHEAWGWKESKSPGLLPFNEGVFPGSGKWGVQIKLGF